jgi:hypothetical protein
MGLTGEAGGRRDLEEARLAIDAFRALVELVGRVRPPEEMAVHRSVLSQLQMNYVGVLDRGGSDEVPAAEPTDTPADWAVDAPANAPTDGSADAAGEALGSKD